MKFLAFLPLLCLARFNYEDPSTYNRSVAHVEGLNYSYIDEGPREGRMVMILHGFPESWFMYKHQIRLLVDLGYRVIGLDMLGYGGSSKPESIDLYTYSSIASNLRALVKDHFGVEKAIFLAHDWGCMFMWNLAFIYPEVVDGLVSVGLPNYEAPPIHLTHEMLVKFVPQLSYQLSISKANTTVLDEDIRGFLETFLAIDPACLRKLSTTPPTANIVEHYKTINCNRTLAVEPKDMEFLIEQFTQSGTKGPTNYYRTYNLNRYSFYTSINKTISQPTLYMSAERDFVRKLPLKYNLSLILDLTHKPIDGGHWILQTHKDLVNEYLGSWILEKFPPKAKLPL